jgi:hypothetical protein
MEFLSGKPSVCSRSAEFRAGMMRRVTCLTSWIPVSPHGEESLDGMKRMGRKVSKSGERRGVASARIHCLPVVYDKGEASQSERRLAICSVFVFLPWSRVARQDIIPAAVPLSVALATRKKNGQSPILPLSKHSTDEPICILQHFRAERALFGSFSRRTSASGKSGFFEGNMGTGGRREDRGWLSRLEKALGSCAGGCRWARQWNV